MGIYYREKVFTIVRISNREAKLLRQMGVKDKENGISATYGHHRSYYLCESKDNMKKLNSIRNK